MYNIGNDFKGHGKEKTTMKLGMTAGVYTGDLADFEKELKQLKTIGFDCIDYQGFVNTQTPLYEMSETDFEAYLCEQKRMVAEVGLEISQVHGPWRSHKCYMTEEGRKAELEYAIKAVRGCAILGGDRMVMHPVMAQGRIDVDHDSLKAVNRAFFLRLCEVGRENGVVICLENMPFPCQCLARPRQTLEFVKTLNSEWFRVCLDTGHCAVLGLSAGDAVRLIGKDYLWVLHVHDNDGLRDRHLPPYDGVLDWDDFSDALAEIDFDGTLSLETVVPKTLDAEGRERMLRELYRQASEIAK